MESNMKRKQNKVAMREWVIANPNASSSDFVKATGGSRTQFYNFRYNWNVTKKRKPSLTHQAKTKGLASLNVTPSTPLSIDATLKEVRKLLNEAKRMASISADYTNKASVLLGESNAATV
jgi:hypothetical protein